MIIPQGTPLKQILRSMVDGFEKLDLKNGKRMLPIERFVLECGTAYPGRKRPRGVRKMRDRQCFKNATELSLSRPDLTYVEGIGLHIIPCHHAWCVDAEGLVVDPTWRYPEKSEYMGVPIPAKTLCEELMRNMVYGVFALKDYSYNTRLMDAIRKQKETKT